MTHPIPTAAQDDRLGFLGTSGSGKTYCAGTVVERLLAKKARVVTVDPLGVWWGLRQAVDGDARRQGRDSQPVVSRAGPHRRTTPWTTSRRSSAPWPPAAPCSIVSSVSRS